MLRLSKVTIFRIVALALALAILELLSALVAAVIPYPRILRVRTLYAEQSSQIREVLDATVPHHTEIHPIFGWRHTPNFADPMNRMNSAALRGAREYAAAPHDGVLRVAAFGDSFVYGAEVDNATAWAGRIERDNQDVEVLNYGVSGYGTDQAYLRYLHEGQAFSPQIVLMGFVPDDFNRNINVYRHFISPGGPLFKPRYVINEREELSLLSVPLKTAADYERLLGNPWEVKLYGPTDYWYPACAYENPLHDYSATLRLACAAGGQVYRRYVDSDRPVKARFFNENSSAFRIQMALFRDFCAAVRGRGALPLIVMLPDLKTVDRRRQGDPGVYAPLLRHLRDLDLPYVDAADVLTDPLIADANALFTPGGHYSALGNRLVASWMTARLREVAKDLPHAVSGPDEINPTVRPHD